MQCCPLEAISFNSAEYALCIDNTYASHALCVDNICLSKELFSEPLSAIMLKMQSPIRGRFASTIPPRLFSQEIVEVFPNATVCASYTNALISFTNFLAPRSLCKTCPVLWVKTRLGPPYLTDGEEPLSSLLILHNYSQTDQPSHDRK